MHQKACILIFNISESNTDNYGATRKTPNKIGSPVTNHRAQAAKGLPPITKARQVRSKAGSKKPKIK